MASPNEVEIHADDRHVETAKLLEMHPSAPKVGIAIDSLMSRRAIEEAAAQKVAEENARVDERIADA
ncbi:hypothetical protein Dimus_025172 [Dionaea muscipula]